MSSGHDRGRHPRVEGPDPFIRPRTIVGLILAGGVVFLTILDAATSYSFPTEQMALMLGTSSVVLGVGTIDRFLRG